MRLFPAVAGALLLLLANMAATHAATVFFYSAIDDYYGWAAGYSYSRSEREARKNCDKGGKDCKFALECDGGWSAAAFADNFATGVAFSCGYANAVSARTAALLTCIVETRTLCRTSSTISNNGNERSEKNNREFDRVWYTQEFLYMRGFEPGVMDGEMGGKTRAALREFQTKLRLEATGVADDAIFARLLDSVGGREGVVEGVKAGVDLSGEKFADKTYAFASKPFAVKTFSEEIATRPEDERRLTLATLLTVWDTPCTLPAKSAEPVPPDGSAAWLVTCNEGEWTVLISNGMHTIIKGLSTVEGAEPETPADGGAPKPGSPGTPGAGMTPPASRSFQLDASPDARAE